MRQLLRWCAVAVLGLGYAAVSAQASNRVLSVQLKRPNIVIRGANLSKVEIWALPTGTGMDEQHLVFGVAAREGAAGQRETWVLRLPACAGDTGEGYLAAQVIAVGFDSTGAEVGRHELQPSLGAIELYKTLCAK